MIEAQELHPTRILGWCIMRNHWHFVVWPHEEGELTAYFRWLAHTHAMRWHVAHNTVGRGHLYQGRFKCFPVEEDEHFFRVCRYVVSWFSGNRNSCRCQLTPREWHPARGIAASCREGLSPWCRSRRGERGRGAGRHPAPAPVSAPGSVLGSHLCVALSSVQDVVNCCREGVMRQPPRRCNAPTCVAAEPLPVCGPARRRSRPPGR